MKLPTKVTVVEVGPRDGLQAEKTWVETDRKIELINALSQTGLSRIEATAFVHPKAIPQMRDSADVMAAITRRPGIIYDAIVPNPVGAQRALGAGVDEISVFVSASETHNQQNVRMSIADSLRGFEPIAQLARDAGRRLRGYIVTSFGCPYEGDVPEDKVIGIGRSLRDLGAMEVSLGDTTGMGNPVQVASMASNFLAKVPNVRLGLHFHNTRGAGLANVLAGLQEGVDLYDGSIGGLGGCPYAPGATGNIPTEDMVHMFHEMGIETGIDMDKMIACAKLAQEMIGRELPGQVMKAGKRCDLVRIPEEKS
ncbi:MAG: hydroxymethylglutaryl-CoA lyase [Chloroflexi bacterium]|nr:hydroxymethylglutaryl-CoA lyase [Chloroflexota bacterium]